MNTVAGLNGFHPVGMNEFRGVTLHLPLSNFDVALKTFITRNNPWPHTPNRANVRFDPFDLRELLGVGTPKQWAAEAKGLFWFLWSFWVAGWSPAPGGKALLVGRLEPSPRKLWRLLERWVKDTARPLLRPFYAAFHNPLISTG